MTVVQLILPDRSSSEATYGLPVLPTAMNTWPSITVGEPLTAAPSLSRCVAHTFWPVSALTANTQPLDEAMNRQPSATIGVPTKSPSPPASDAETANALCSVGAVVRSIVCSLGWLRLLAR